MQTVTAVADAPAPRTDPLETTTPNQADLDAMRILLNAAEARMCYASVAFTTSVLTNSVKAKEYYGLELAAIGTLVRAAKHCVGAAL